MKKFPDQLNVTCWKCEEKYVYERQSRSGLTYWLSDDEKLCACFEPSLPPETFSGNIEYVKIYPRALKIGKRRF